MEDEKKMPSEDISEKTDNSLSDGDEPLDSDAELTEVDFIPLDSLLYENDESAFDSGASEKNDGFESFFAEYRELIAESFVAARKMKADEEPSPEIQSNEATLQVSEPTVDKESDKVSKSSEKKKSKPQGAQSSDDRQDSITLKPEDYEPLPAAEEEIFCEEPVVEEEDIDLLLGEVTEEQSDEENEDEAQISFFPDSKPKILENDDGDTKKIKKYDPENPRKIDTAFDFLELFIYTLVAVMVLTTFFFKHSVVEGDSMNNTLEDGDHLIIWDAFYTPDRYDIIVFEDYSTSLKKAVVKRVIGLPGETVEIKKNGNGEFLVYIDGELIEEEYAYYGIHYSSPNTGVWTLGENEIFVMGDNRYNSTDSRDYGVGSINIDSILGKVVLRFFPFDKFGTFN